MRDILIHGLGQNAASWDKTISALPEQRDVGSPDLATLMLGNECIYENMYRAFSSYCWESGNAVNLCGLSLGAVLALNAALDHPDKVSSLILIAPQYKMPKLLLQFQNIVFRLMPNSAFRGMGFDKKTLIKLTKSMMDLDFSARLQDISCPTLVLCGKQDRVNRGACETAARSIPNAELVIIEHSGHEVNADAPETLGGIIHSFFSKAQAPPSP